MKATRNHARTLTALTALAFVALGAAFVPAAAAQGEDWCNGLVERDGCVYEVGGIIYGCKLWVAGVCVEGAELK
jgi:hypothetical protein